MQRFFNILAYLSGLVCLFLSCMFLLDITLNLTLTHQLFTPTVNYIFYFFIAEILLICLLKRSLTPIFTRPTDIAAFLPFFYAYIPDITFFPILFIKKIALLIIFIGRIPHIYLVFSKLKLSPTQMVLLGFFYPIAIGGTLLSLPLAAKPGVDIPFIDALFTATSAICVTGLSTLSISESFSLFGQSVIMILIQIGGLGIMGFSLIFSLFLQKKLTQKESSGFQSTFNANTFEESKNIFKSLFKYTLIFEVVGAFLLYIFWPTSFSGWQERLYVSTFHSISAFCNAGFALFSDSLMTFSTHTPILMIISGLVILGGLGFPVLYDLAHPRIKPLRFQHLRLQTKLILSSTLILLVVGTVFIFLAERSNFEGTSTLQSLLSSFFLSVTSRTAGFNTVATELLHPATLFIVTILMFIGAAPGSTGGGIKTTTFSIIVTTFWNHLRGKPKNHVFGRSITVQNVYKSLTVFLLAFVLIFCFTTFLLIVENKAFMPVFFEVISAFSTVGLSMGITSSLSFIGKMTIILLMFIGRVGPLTFAFGLMNRKVETEHYEYPEETILTA